MMNRNEAWNRAMETVAFMSWGGVQDACKNYGIPIYNNRGGLRQRGTLEHLLLDAMASKIAGHPVGKYRIIFYRADSKRTSSRTCNSFFEAEDTAREYLRKNPQFSTCICNFLEDGTEAFRLHNTGKHYLVRFFVCEDPVSELKFKNPGDALVCATTWLDDEEYYEYVEVVRVENNARQILLWADRNGENGMDLKAQDADYIITKKVYEESFKKEATQNA